MSSINLDDLSLEELVSLQADIEKHISDLQKQQKTAFLSEFRAKAKALGFSFDELVEAGQRLSSGKKGKSVPDKYQDPESGKTWTGRGRKPAWVIAQLEQGKTLDDLLIDSGDDGAGV